MTNYLCNKGGVITIKDKVRYPESIKDKFRYPELNNFTGNELRRRLNFYKHKSQKCTMEVHLKVLDILYLESSNLHDEFSTYHTITNHDFVGGFTKSQVYNLMSKYTVYEAIEQNINDVLDALMCIEELFNKKYPFEDIGKLLPQWA